MDYIRSGKVEKGSTVIYLHTGGATALFSENAIIGDLNVLQYCGIFHGEKSKE